MSMTDLLIQSKVDSGGGGDMYRVLGVRDGCRSPVIGRYSSSSEERPAGLGLNELKHSKSDDLILQSAPLSPPEISHGISEASLQIQREAAVVYEQDLNAMPLYFSDTEATKSSGCAGSATSPSSPSACSPPNIVVLEKPPLKITGDFSAEGCPSRRTSQYIHDRIDPEDSIRDIISENDFYRFVLFKRHYEKYLDISKKYEEARNIAYYLEEKYHEIKAERDHLTSSNRELEGRLERREAEMHEKEDELFLQLEKAIRLEEDCEKLKTEKEKVCELKDKLEKEKNELYRKLKLQADESEANRRRLERARNDVFRQVTEITAEKDILEKENTRLRDALEDIERRTMSRKNKRSVEKELMELKLVAKQSATLNSQLKKGMKHLASCRRRKCSVCAYTRSTFGEYTAAVSPQRGKVKLLSCLGGGDLGGGEAGRLRRSSGSTTPATPEPSLAEQLSQRLSELSLLSPGAPDILGSRLMAYIDDCGPGSATEASDDEDDAYAPASAVAADLSLASSAPHAFSSDSGFSSGGDPSLMTPSKSLRRATAWTSSFKKLIRRVSKRHPSNVNQQTT